VKNMTSKLHGLPQGYAISRIQKPTIGDLDEFRHRYCNVCEEKRDCPNIKNMTYASVKHPVLPDGLQLIKKADGSAGPVVDPCKNPLPDRIIYCSKFQADPYLITSYGTNWGENSPARDFLELLSIKDKKADERNCR